MRRMFELGNITIINSAKHEEKFNFIDFEYCVDWFKENSNSSIVAGRFESVIWRVLSKCCETWSQASHSAKENGICIICKKISPKWEIESRGFWENAYKRAPSWSRILILSCLLLQNSFIMLDTPLHFDKKIDDANIDDDDNLYDFEVCIVLCQIYLC